MDPWLTLAGLGAPAQAGSTHLQPLGPVDGPQWPEHPQDSQDLHHVDGTGPGGMDGGVNHSCSWARRREGEHGSPGESLPRAGTWSYPGSQGLGEQITGKEFTTCC